MNVDDRIKEVVQAALRARLVRGPQLILMVMHTMNQIGWRPSELCRLTSLSAASVGMILHDYRHNGMVEKLDLHRDKRSGRYHLTEKGTEKAAELWRLLWRMNDIRAKHYRMPIPD